MLIRLAIAALILSGAAGFAAEPDPAQVDFFEREIRPLLIERCHKCHGDAKDIKGGLRLTSRASVLAGGDSGPAAILDKPDASPIIEAVRYQGLEMPPDGKLSQNEVAALTRWIELGIPWPDSPAPAAGPQTQADAARIRAEQRQSHWAFQKIAKPALPPVQDAAWPKNPIDRFVLAALERQGLHPSQPADKRTLIRRATFDLIGLPPTPDEVEDFLRDDSPAAMARLVDRLLASGHYGERWGRYWLDIARYADTKGYVLFEEAEFPWSYTYRDYVVRALNEDLPYDRFVVEQLAADQLELGEDKRALTAMGFVTIGGHFMNNMHDVIDDRIDVITRGLLGMTVSCARCHDHKFDPIPTQDYYSLYGVLASSAEPLIPPLFQSPPETEEYAAYAKGLDERRQKLAQFVQKKYEELKEATRTRAAEYLLAAHAIRGQPNTEEFMLLAESEDLNPDMIRRWRNFLDWTRKNHHPVFAPWHALASLEEAEFSDQAQRLASEFLSPRDPSRPINPIVARALAENSPATMADVAQRYGELLAEVHHEWQRAVAQAAKENRPPPTGLSDPVQEELRSVIYGRDTPADIPSSPVGDLGLLPDRASQKIRNDLLKEVETWRSTAPGAPPRAMTLEDVDPLVDPRVFIRGNPSRFGDVVPRQFLEALSPAERKPFEHGSGRLELARAIVDPANPLAARVHVNRIWLHHFGAALVATPGDFGLRSEPPTHPDLLDYLASTFVEGGWSTKRMHRLIMLSAVYQQQSDDRPDCLRVDPENRWLWKMNRRRLDFETTRDSLLAAAGRLDRTMGGPAQKNIIDPASRRRTLYGFIDRLNLPNLYRMFDFPSPNATSPERDLTTVPQQALFLMNNPLATATARSLIERPEVASAPDASARIARLYRLLYAREPTEEELGWGRDFIGGGAEEAWARYAQGLLLANEFVFVD